MVPLLIQDVAANGGVQASDHSIPCDTSVADYKCVKRFFGDHYFDPGTLSLYVSSISAIVSFFISLSIAAVADHGAYRKRLLLVFAILGCLASVAFYLVTSPDMFWLTVVLSPLGWSCYNVSSVFSNAFLPIYVRVHPDVLEATERVEAQKKLQELDEKNRSMIETASAENHSRPGSSMIFPPALTRLNSNRTTRDSITAVAALRKEEEKVSNALSARCAGAANIGAVVIQAICAGISFGMGNSLLSLKTAIAFTGVWWLVWTIVVMPWLDARPGPPLPKGQNWILYSWTKNYETLRSMRQLSQVTKFIFAWFILSDGANTVVSLFYVIAYQELRMSHTQSVIMTMIISSSAFLGAYIFLYIRQRWELSTKFMMMLSLVLYTVLSAYFVVPSYFTTSFGLRQEWEVWVATAYMGLIISTFFGVARVMMAELCPEGDENEWFSLFQLADKGSSWIGPFITGAIESVTGEFRAGFWFPIALFVAGGMLLLTVNVNKGKDEAIAYKNGQRSRHLLLAAIPPITVTTTGDGSH
ncbi:Autophagy protein 22 [Mortierella sp. GBA43]|nr:Autophagy protein 22 [Mortierella sp. GBA43]